MHHVVGALVVVDQDRVEQRLVAASEILGRDELEGDAEGLQRGGVAGELGFGKQHVEGESRATRRAAATGSGRRGRGLERGKQGLGVTAIARDPGAQGARRECQRATELLLGKAMDAVQALPCSHDQALHSASAQGDPREDRGDDLEQGASASELSLPLARARVVRGTTPAGQLGQERFHPSQCPGDEATDPHGTDALALGSLLQLHGEPGGLKAVHQAQGQQGE
jgi:hypothetical protein